VVGGSERGGGGCVCGGVGGLMMPFLSNFFLAVFDLFFFVLEMMGRARGGGQKVRLILKIICYHKLTAVQCSVVIFVRAGFKMI
jgi:hypothetical protein